MKANKWMTPLLALALLSLASCGEKADEQKAADATPAAEPKPAEEATPAAEPKPAEEATPAEEIKDAEEPTPAADDNAAVILPDLTEEVQLEATETVSDETDPAPEDDLLVPDVDVDSELESLESELNSALDAPDLL
ncbi:MAG TPA: hypothetical protein H9862_04285 [Candidatus Akkermansia intestinigallinarum]|uniref:Uncharacterized protein n=1 Tax=Candidatus Akkermansia intestinigallinarum TaxID=2838431 RepID=A0A9D2AGX8_9BACT|nr:hypothetical protein [Candidatus Akkermansia intestinigallinarum]